jgi:nickel/cobalt exporter
MLLGLSAAISHSLIVWLLAAFGLGLGDALIAERATPYLLIGSGVLVIAIAIWMLLRAPHSHHTYAHAGHEHDAPACEAPHAHEHSMSPHRQSVTKRQVIGFGLTAGLLPCPSAVAVLILCLNAGALTLGFGIVAAFSLGLAATLVSVGVVAALGASYAAERFGFWQRIGHYAPRISAGLISLAGLAAIVQGVGQLTSAPL